MKRIIAFLLVAFMTMGVIGCKKTSQPSGNTSSDASSSAQSSSSNGQSTTSSTPQKSEVELLPGKVINSFQYGTDKVVVCFGDSITWGWNSPGRYVYPSQLEANLDGQYKVINAGIAGEKTAAIASRANAIDFCLTNDVVFAKGVAKVSLDRELFSTADGEVIQYLGFGYELPHDTIIIEGKTYKIEYEKGEEYQHGIYTIVRSDTSTALTLKKGTPVKYDYSSQFKECHVAIFLSGANDADSGSDKLIARYKKFAETYDKYIIIAPFFYDDHTAKFEEEFGDHVINPRKYAYERHAFTDYGLTPTKLDEWCIKKGRMPATFLLGNNKDEMHLSSWGYKLVADMVYKKGVELGYWK